VRLVVAPYTSNSNDIGPWYQTSLAGLHGLTLYQRPGFSYPPVWGYLLEGLGQVFRMVGIGPSSLGMFDARYASLSTVTGDFSVYVTSPLFNVAFKSLLFAGDLAACIRPCHPTNLIGASSPSRVRRLVPQPNCHL